MSPKPPPYGVLIRGELQLAICGSFESFCWVLEDIKIVGATAERQILELERGCGRLGLSVLSRAQEENVRDMDCV